MIYWISTVLFSIIIVGSIFLYVTQYDRFSAGFLKLGYPSYLLYPLAIAKSLGLFAIWFRKVDWLKEWAYAGFFICIALAISAHFSLNTGDYHNALAAMVFMLISYVSQKYAFKD